MPCIVVTLDVSRLSAWLNVDASCRVETRDTVWGKMRGVGRDTRAVQGTCWGAHGEHAVHGYDAGRVETQQLVERGCRLPSGKQG
eukprot:scaffold30850_cov73-Phaeocystis_antarctica.AAC.7